MLFSSLPFIFCFLPLLLFLWYKIPAVNSQCQKNLLFLFLAASLTFYSLWGIPYVLLLILMSFVNFQIAKLLEKSHIPINRALFSQNYNIPFRKLLFIGSIIANILCLCWFKYSAFIFTNMAEVFNWNMTFSPPALPPGISFYTFIQIGFLSDVYMRSVSSGSYSTYLLFSSGFPWLISGPIIRKEDVACQLENLHPLSADLCAKGCALFSIGFAKKIILADPCGFYADKIFHAAGNAWPLSFLEAWLGSFFYTFQLYFDFSGYTDMALGLGLLLGLKLPENFNSPYLATSIIDFWHRWHITLGKWIRDYLYIPMGGNRNGRCKKYLRLFTSMFLAGIWHGAGWTYLLWGSLHGLMLVINHAWRDWKNKTHMPEKHSGITRMLSIIFTFLCINFCWVVFRAPDLDAASRIYEAMFYLPWQFVAKEDNLFYLSLHHNYIGGQIPFILLAVCSIICWTMPTSARILDKVFEKIDSTIKIKFSASLFAVLSFFALLCSGGTESAFLYFQF